MRDSTPTQFSRGLAEAFQAACLITGCLRRSEQVVCLAIELVDISRLDSRDLLAETVRLSAISLADASPNERRDVARYLAPELDAVLDLETLPRCSFVARVLLGFSLADCVRLLENDAMDITLALLTAVGCLRQNKTYFVSPGACVFTQIQDAAC